MSHIVSKICLTLMSIDKSPTDIFFHDQTKKPLAADFLTKVDLLLSYQDIFQYLREGWRRATDWMGTNPKNWSHLSQLSESGQKQKENFDYHEITLRQMVEEEEGGGPF